MKVYLLILVAEKELLFYWRHLYNFKNILGRAIATSGRRIYIRISKIHKGKKISYIIYNRDTLTYEIQDDINVLLF